MACPQVPHDDSEALRTEIRDSLRDGGPQPGEATAISEPQPQAHHEPLADPFAEFQEGDVGKGKGKGKWARDPSPSVEYRRDDPPEFSVPPLVHPRGPQVRQISAPAEQSNVQWWTSQQQQAGGGPPAHRMPYRDIRQQQAPPAGPPGPPDAGEKLTSLGHLRKINSPLFPYYEWRYLTFIKEVLTVKWHIVQGSTSETGLALFKEIIQTLELDERASQDLMLLVHSGWCGRCEANALLWKVLSVEALKEEYLDLSRKVTSLVNEARRYLDRPPWTHPDHWTWSWSHYTETRHEHFDPHAAPPEGASNFEIVLRRDGVPQKPPAMWREIGGHP